MNFSNTECILIKAQSKIGQIVTASVLLSNIYASLKHSYKPLSKQTESYCFLTNLYVNKKDTI